MNPLERYLSRATRGLWGRRRAEARQELASHVFERARQLMAGGMCESEAERQVLAELGAPEAVSRGLTSVHTLPVAAPALALALLVGGAGLLATQAAAQVRVSVPVYSDDAVVDPTVVYVSVQTLRAAFAKAGVTMTGPLDQPTLRAKGLRTITLRLGYMGQGTYDARQRGDLYDGFNFTTQQYQPYLNVVSLAGLAAEQGWPVKLSGWDKPELTIGPALLELNDLQTAEALYHAEATTQLFGGLCASKILNIRRANVLFSNWPGLEPYAVHTLAGTSAQPGQVYGLAMPFANDRLNTKRYDGYYLAVAQADAEGRLTFNLPAAARHLQMVSTVDELAPTVEKLVAGAPTYEDPTVRGAAVLFKLNGTVTISDSCKTTFTPLNFTGTSDSR